MKKIVFIVAIILALFMLAACVREDAGITRIDGKYMKSFSSSVRNSLDSRVNGFISRYSDEIDVLDIEHGTDKVVGVLGGKFDKYWAIVTYRYVGGG